MQISCCVEYVIVAKKSVGCSEKKKLYFNVQHYYKAVAIDSRLSPAKVCWRQLAVSSKLLLVTAGCQ